MKGFFLHISFAKWMQGRDAKIGKIDCLCPFALKDFSISSLLRLPRETNSAFSKEIVQMQDPLQTPFGVYDRHDGD